MDHRLQRQHNNREYVKNSEDFGILLYNSTNNILSKNSVTNSSTYAMYVSFSNNNIIYHNNFLNNTKQVYSENSTNTWDDGYPSGGNYWSNYTSVDADGDGIGDTPYVIDENNVDNYPLMGLFNSFNTSLGHPVDVISNSTVEDFKYFDFNHTIRIIVSNMTVNQTYGFCRLTIPHELIASPYTVTVNHKPVEYKTIFENATLSILYFTYQHPTQEITIIPEIPSTITLFTFYTLLIIALVFTKRRKRPPRK